MQRSLFVGQPAGLWGDAVDGRGDLGWPPDRENAKKVLRRALELGVNFIDTADAYGPETNELLIAEAVLIGWQMQRPRRGRAI